MTSAPEGNLNKKWSRVVTLIANRAFRLEVASHVTNFNQSECINQTRKNLDCILGAKLVDDRIKMVVWPGRQCDQMDRLFVQCLAIYSNQNLHKSKTIFDKVSWILKERKK